jgi:hypothetical protein
MCKQRVGGKYIYISHGSPDMRIVHLSKVSAWKVAHQPLPQGYQLYVCLKNVDPTVEGNCDM